MVVMIIWDYKGILFIVFKEYNVRINEVYYEALLHKLR